MGKKLSFSIAVNLLTENFKKGTSTVKNSLRAIQMQIISFAAALGAGGLGVAGLLARFKDVARETSRVITALKNVSDGTKGFADNLRFINEMAEKYGLEVNALTGNFAKFTASASQANMPMEQQKKVFESLSRASTAFGLSAEDTNGVFLALSQMMGKGKISSEELRKQMGERIPIAMQAMAKAAGVSVAGLEKLLQQGKLMSSEVIPKFADALNEMIPNVDTDNIETSLNRLKNTFGEIINSSGFQNKYKALIDGLTSLLQSASENIQNIIVGIVAAIGFVVTNGLTKVYRGYEATGKQIIANASKKHDKLRTAIRERVEAVNKLEELKLQHAQAIGSKQTSLATKIEKQKQVLTAKTAQVNIAHENAKAAAAEAAAIKSKGAWATAFATISGSAKKLMISLKSLWNSFAPAIMVSALIAIVGHFRNLYNETKRVKNIFSEYKNGVENLSNTTEIVHMKELQETANNINASYEDRKVAIDIINKKLGTNYSIDKDSLKINGDINEKIADRIKLLEAQAKVNYYSEEKVRAEDDLKKIYKKYGGEQKFNSKYLSTARKNEDAILGHIGFGKLVRELEKANQLRKIITDAKKEISDALIYVEKNAPKITDTPTTPDSEPDDKALRAAEKRLEAVEWLKNKQNELDNEIEKNKLELEQRILDLDEESFNKRKKQAELNQKKELLSIKEFEAKKKKEQIEAAKKIYISENNGSEKGFDFNKFDKSKLPEGLRIEDIQAEVKKRELQATKEYDKEIEDLLKSILDEYKNYNDQRKELNEQYSDDEATLLKLRNRENASVIDAALDELKKSRTKAIKEINDTEAREFMKSTDLFVELFENASEKSVNELKSIIDKATELRKVLKDDSEDIPEWFIDSQIKNKETLSSEQLDQAREAVKKYIEELRKQPGVIKDYEDAVKSLLDSLGERSPLLAFSHKLEKAIAKIKEGADTGDMSKIGGGIEGISDAVQQLMPTFEKFCDDLGQIFGDGAAEFMEGVKSAISVISEIGSGVGKIMSGDISGVLDIVSGVAKIFGHEKQINKEHREALRLLEMQAAEQNHLYNLEKQRESLTFEKGESVFGTDKWGKASNAAKVYNNSVKNLDESLKALEGVDVVTGSKTTGALFWKKRKDVWSDLLSAYPRLIDANGKFDKSLAETILTTQKLSDEGKQAIQQAIDNAELMEEAFEELKNYLSDVFSELGNNIMNAFVNAFKGTKNAISDFVDDTSKILGNLVKDFIYSIRLAPIIEKASQEAEKVMINNALTDDQKNQKLIDITGNLIDGLIKQKDLIFEDLERWGEIIEKELGTNPFDSESTTQSASSGKFESMDQDTGNRLDGRFAALQMSGVKIEGFLSTLTDSSRNIFNSSISINDELKTHTILFNEIKKIHINGFYEIEGTKSLLKNIYSVLDRIDRNTSNI